MARIKIAYIGGGSTRGAGTMASFIAQGRNLAGSEIVLIDLVPDRLRLVKRLANKMAREQRRRHQGDCHHQPARRAAGLRCGADQL